MKFAEEVHHIDRLKANFSVSEAEYIATTARSTSSRTTSIGLSIAMLRKL